MVKFKRKINRNKLNGEFFYIDINLQQSIRNIGTFTDVPFSSNLVKPDLSTNRVNIKAYSHSNLSLFKRYGNTDNYVDRFIKETGSYFDGEKTINWHNAFTKSNVNLIENSETGEQEIVSKSYFYTLGGPILEQINVEYPEHGINYEDVYDIDNKYVHTIAKYKSSKQDYTFSSFNSIISEEFNIGITDILEVNSDIENIERGSASAFENIQKLSEINNINQLSQYSEYFKEII